MRIFINIVLSLFLIHPAIGGERWYLGGGTKLRLLMGSENLVIAKIKGPLIRKPKTEDVITKEYNDILASETVEGEKLQVTWQAFEGSFEEVYYVSRYSRLQRKSLNPKVMGGVGLTSLTLLC